MTNQNPPTPDQETTGADDSQAVEPTQGATTLLEILAELRPLGFAAQFMAKEDAKVECVSCRASNVMADLDVAGFRRVEGASDAADLNIVVWCRCASCRQGGTLILGYGPNASAADAAVLDQLSLDNSSTPGATPREASA